MIKLHKLNGGEILVNAELIETVENVPDTIITFYTNNRLVVKESMEEVQRLVIEYKQISHNPNLPVVSFGRKDNV
jgi:flagellar protein FlbD